MIEITPGAIVVGENGGRLIVDRIEGDILYSGSISVCTSAVYPYSPKDWKN
jgi:hypothetical protein